MGADDLGGVLVADVRAYRLGVEHPRHTTAVAGVRQLRPVVRGPGAVPIVPGQSLAMDYSTSN